MTLKPARHPEPARLLAWVERLSGGTAVVWGDFVLDEYWRCLSRRVSREAPVLILEHQGRAIQGGGAAHAALNLAALGAPTRAVGFVGKDAEARELRGMLERAGVDCEGLIEVPRQSTVVKTRIVAGSAHTALQQVVRVDRGRPFRLGVRERQRLAAALERAEREAKAVLLSDYGYDSVTPELARQPIRRWRTRGVTVGLDARFRVSGYRGVTLATPNESEASAASGVVVESDQDLIRVAEVLLRRTRTQHLLVTRGRDGLTLWGRNGGRSLAAWGGHEAVDVTGAGDAVVAVATLALAVGAGPLESAALANVAGAVAVSRRGAVAVSKGELLRALRDAPDGPRPRRPAAGARR
jgi:rfaE bifunctional protein kinase chain/domain